MPTPSPPPPSHPASAGACRSTQLSGLALQPPLSHHSGSPPELHRAGSFPNGSPVSLSQHPLLLPLQEQGAAHKLPPETPPPSQPDPCAREQGGAICAYIRVCMYIHICNALFLVSHKKAPSQPVPVPCALISGTAPTWGWLPPSPSVPPAHSPCTHPWSCKQAVLQGSQGIRTSEF